ISIAREFREQLASLGSQLAYECRFLFRDGTQACSIISGTGGEQAFDSLELDWNAPALKQLEHIIASSSRSQRHRGFARGRPEHIRAFARNRRIRSMVEQYLEDFQGII